MAREQGYKQSAAEPGFPKQTIKYLPSSNFPVRKITNLKCLRDNWKHFLFDLRQFFYSSHHPFIPSRIISNFCHSNSFILVKHFVHFSLHTLFIIYSFLLWEYKALYPSHISTRVQFALIIHFLTLFLNLETYWSFPKLN